jgi:chaperonin cofactor prefoldin
LEKNELEKHLESINSRNDFLEKKCSDLQRSLQEYQALVQSEKENTSNLEYRLRSIEKMKENEVNELVKQLD